MQPQMLQHRIRGPDQRTTRGEKTETLLTHVWMPKDETNAGSRDTSSKVAVLYTSGSPCSIEGSLLANERMSGRERQQHNSASGEQNDQGLK